MNGAPREGGASAAWALWAAPDRSRVACVVTPGASSTPFRMTAMYARVEVWVTDPAAAAAMADRAREAGAGIAVEHVDVERVADRLVGEPGDRALIAFEELLAGVPRAASALRGRLLSGLARATRESGQAIVVDRNRYAFDDLRASLRRLRPDPVARRRPTAGEVLRGLRAGGADPGPPLFFHPDHRRPEEILGWSGTLPGSRRGPLDRLFEAAGAVRALHGSFACFAPDRSRPTVLDDAVALARPWTGAGGDPARGACVIRDNGMLMLTLGLGGSDEAILRVPMSADARATLEASIGASRALQATHPGIHARLPEVLAVETVHGWTAHLERKCVGRTALGLLKAGTPRADIREEILRFVLDLHLPSRTAQVVDDAFVERHFAPHARIVREAEPELAGRIDAIVRGMAARARGKRLPTVRIHGDLNVGNVLFDPSTPALRTVLDWDASLPDSLPFDLVHYLISEKRVFDDVEWGPALARIVAGDGLDDDDRAFLARHHEAIGLDADAFVPFLCAYWLRGVAVRTRRSGGRLNARWRERNLLGPLEVVSDRMS